MRVLRQVTGSLTKPLEDPNALFRFHEDEKEGPLLNCRSIWFQNAREPLLVVSELLYTMLNLRLSLSQRGQDLKANIMKCTLIVAFSSKCPWALTFECECASRTRRSSTTSRRLRHPFSKVLTKLQFCSKIH